jgi:glutamate 5-kinase
MTTTRSIGTPRRVVIKLGSNVVTRAQGRAATDRLQSIVESVGELRRAGCDVVLISSGAVKIGTDALQPDTLLGAAHGNSMRQACAAVGQNRLAMLYQQAFERWGVVVAQLLLTSDDFATPARSRRLRSTLETLLACGAVPVLNENDAVPGRILAGDRAPSRCKTRAFRDNDMLAALAARLVRADLVLFLTDVDGVLSPSPARSVIPVIRSITPAVRAGVRGGSGRGLGGMASKLDAAWFAARGGANAVIANGHVPGVIDRVLAGEQIGTLVPGGRCA